ncbi:efflux RND transporter periplasmic adaptor subunit [Anaeroselena agilis]|uniref:Efflux RND transporter periplasmic adaptor subunit n=1 Tax=Anaeroselena agilis TaxID=3063788 RepID=A0ABU3P0H5_9FIRM|nr:efflux RND transporter periplasmic adaptor subunit [Selenomonadales bacterium 4137-cl]
MLRTIGKRSGYAALVAAVLVATTVAGCGGKPARPAQAVAVKATQVIKRDTPVTYEYVGQVTAKNEVQIRAKVSGNIVGKMVSGGAAVTEGQPLFQIDRRQYETALLSARATLAQSEATLANSRLDTIRYRKLYDQQAIAKQAFDTQLSAEAQHAAVVDANRAKVQQAVNDLNDTLIVAPFSGRIGVQIPDIGSYVSAGSTVLATISTVDPVFVQFSMSETEYLKFTRIGKVSAAGEWGKDLTLLLSDGSKYPITGQIEQVDRGLSQETGTLTMKASFANPQKILIPGMFARIVAQGEMRTGALLVPERAVQEMLGKTFITVVAEGDKAESRPVKMGPKVGTMWIVEDGLAEGDRIVVEGFAKAPPGTPLKVSMIEPEPNGAAKPASKAKQ